MWKMYLPFKMDSAQHHIVLFNEWMPACHSSSFMRFLKRKYNVSTVLVIRNLMKNKEHPMIGNSSLDELKNRFDLVVTTEKVDADMFGLPWFWCAFSKIECDQGKLEWDCCFVGKDQGRLPKLEAFAKEAEAQKIRNKIRIVRREPGISDIKSISFSKRIPYCEIIKNDLKSNCILEILQEGQKTSSLRFLEAVCLNKKLLTNNPYVKQEKEYNPQFMQVFDDIKDIDWDFVRDVIPVDYHYDGRFSPIRWLENIEQELHKKFHVDNESHNG